MLGSLQDLREALQRGEAQWCVLALDYEFGVLTEPRAGWSHGALRERPGTLYRFSECREFDQSDAEQWLSQACANLPEEALSCGIGGITPSCSVEEHRDALRRIAAWIEAGDCYQVNFTYALSFNWWGHPLALYAALRARQPVRHGGLLRTRDQTVLSLSPELFLAREGERVWVRPMKGTAPRATDAEHLRLSSKNRAENLMIVDLLRNDLGKVAETGSVQVESLFEIEDYPTVWQMVSQVGAKVAGKDAADLLAAMFPCGSVTGAPKLRAMQIIDALETLPRGLYTGAFGLVRPGGDFCLNVPIRTLELDCDGRGKMGVGSGVVADSDPDAEWRECVLKAEFLSDFDPGLLLIETLRRENGVYPRLDGHLQRLASSATWLGFICDRADVERQLHALPNAGTERVRLALDKQGRVDLRATPLDPEPQITRFALLAQERIDAHHPLRRHKTSFRAPYDRALASLAGNPSLFDCVFLNQEGEVVEGARSNVFVERDGQLLTPPLSSGALPGVLRAELLAAGRAIEASLTLADLSSGFWMGNALRGLIQVRLRG